MAISPPVPVNEPLLDGNEEQYLVWPMHEQPVFRRIGPFSGKSHPAAERIARCGFYIPSGMVLTDAQIRRAVQAGKDVLA